MFETSLHISRISTVNDKQQQQQPPISHGKWTKKDEEEKRAKSVN